MAFDNTQVFTLKATETITIGVYAGDYNVIKTGTALAYPISRPGTWGEGGGSINPSPGTLLYVGAAQVDVLYVYSQEGTTGSDLLAYIVRWCINSDTYSGDCQFAMNWIGEGIVDNATAPFPISSHVKLSHPTYNFDHSKMRVITKPDGSIVAYRLPGSPGVRNACDILPAGADIAHDLDLPSEHKELLIKSPREALTNLRVAVRNGRALLQSLTLPLPPPRA
jgi:hypothetical protein